MEERYLKLMREFVADLDAGHAVADVGDYPFAEGRKFGVGYEGDDGNPSGLEVGAAGAGTLLISHTRLADWVEAVDRGDFDVVDEVDDDAWPLLVDILGRVDGLRVDLEDVRSARD